jgi:hypothetical protein
LINAYDDAIKISYNLELDGDIIKVTSIYDFKLKQKFIGVAYKRNLRIEKKNFRI